MTDTAAMMKLKKELPDRLLNRHEVQALTGLAQASIDRKEKPFLKDGTANPYYDPTWPRRVRMNTGPTSPVRWWLSEIMAWMKALQRKEFGAVPENFLGPVKPKRRKHKFPQTNY